MDSPIPIPPAQRWKDFRIQGVPLLVFAMSVVAIAHLWRNHVGSATMVGEAEAIRTQVSTPQEGTLRELRVSRFQLVSEGDPVAVIVPSESRVQLSLLQLQLELLRLRFDPSATTERLALDYERLRLDWMQQKVDLASGQVALQRAEEDLRRNAELFAMHILSTQVYEAAEATRNRLRAEIEERTRLIQDIETGIRRHESVRTADTERQLATEQLADGLRRIETRLRSAEALLEPVILKAPRSGMVSAILHQPGELVRDGAPVLAITAQKPERIVGYLRQPLAIEPQPGMKVVVTTRSARRLTGEAQIRHVAFQFEPVTNTLASLLPGKMVDMGLPVEVSVPSALTLRPGEHVDLTIVAE